ncbi:MAG: Rpn family recombination-promoting nuclease/putative transposase [Oscillospiraceae bacterium]|nr:Rpn family recombination-promoting nuclease/putative transposase [Oscillospiraceae bacterium]
MVNLNTIELETDQDQKHDEGYKGIFANKANFLHFLQKYIAEPWAAQIDPNQMERIDKSFITQEYRKKDSDLIYKLKINGEDVYFYVLMELQSEVDFTMPFRLLRYMVELLNDIFKNTEEKNRERKGFKLPAVVPIILYNGMRSWTAVRSYKEYTANHDIFGNNIINFSYLLFDLNRTDDETIASTKKVLDIIFALNKINPNEDKIEETIKILTNFALQLKGDEAVELTNWTEYVHFKGDAPDDFKEKFKQAIAKGDVDSMTHSIEIMRDRRDRKWLNEGIQRGRQEGIQTGIQRGRQEGRQEGIQRGKLEAAIENAVRMIKKGFAFDVVKEVTGLPDEELMQLYN